MCDLFVEVTGVGNWNRVAIDHRETFLVDRVLTFRLGHFLFSWVSQQRILEFGIRDKAWSDLMVVHSFVALPGEIFFDIEIG